MQINKSKFSSVLGTLYLLKKRDTSKANHQIPLPTTSDQTLSETTIEFVIKNSRFSSQIFYSNCLDIRNRFYMIIMSKQVNQQLFKNFIEYRINPTVYSLNEHEFGVRHIGLKMFRQKSIVNGKNSIDFFKNLFLSRFLPSFMVFCSFVKDRSIDGYAIEIPHNKQTDTIEVNQ